MLLTRLQWLLNGSYSRVVSLKSTRFTTAGEEGGGYALLFTVFYMRSQFTPLISFLLHSLKFLLENLQVGFFGVPLWFLDSLEDEKEKTK